jgi:hypothetical protein
MPTPVPPNTPPTPTGTPRPPGAPRPKLSTLEELHLAKVDLADSTVLDRPQRDINALMIYNLRELKSATSERDVALFTELSTIKQQGASANAKASSTNYLARFSAFAGPALLFLISVGGEWGKANPQAFGGVGAALVALSAALAGLRGKTTSANAEAATPARPPGPT